MLYVVAGYEAWDYEADQIQVKGQEHKTAILFVKYMLEFEARM